MFDGHAGFKASKYCAKHLAPAVLARLAAGEADRGLAEAFKETDAAFLRKLEDCGTTAVVSVVDCEQRTLIVANAGDSRCVLASEAEGAGVRAAMATMDHKPSDAGERQRIEEAGHEVEQDVVLEGGKRIAVARVDGRVACSRSIGDGELKDYGVAPEKQAITCVPDVSSRPLARGRDRFVLLATDGVWDVVSSDDAVAFVAERLAAAQAITQETVSSIAESLVRHAVVDLGSMDNTSAVIGVFVWE